MLIASDNTTSGARGETFGASCLPSAALAAWYAVWTRSHCERSVAQQLSARGFEVFLPETGRWSRSAGAPRLVQVPMFPGYLFLRAAMDKHQYADVLKARGIVRVLGDGWNRLATIPESDVAAIQRVMAADVPVLPHAHLSTGDRVAVVHGPLAGVEGLFLHDGPHKGRLILSIDLLGRSVAVEVDCSAVVPCSIRKYA